MTTTEKKLAAIIADVADLQKTVNTFRLHDCKIKGSKCQGEYVPAFRDGHDNFDGCKPCNLEIERDLRDKEIWERNQ